MALVIPIRLCCAQDVSAFYTLPQGAFVGTVTEQGSVAAESSVYIPYSPEGHTWTSIDPQADSWWYIGSTNETYGTSYKRTDPMNSSYYVPQLREGGKINYQYGAIKQDVFRTESMAYVGDSVSHFMTPAKLYCDIVQATEDNSANTLYLVSYYSTVNHDTVGLYFNNTDVMYIEAIRIPITSDKSGETVNDLFSTNDSHIKVTIYPATSIGGKTNNCAQKTDKLAELTLNRTHFTVNSSFSNRGTVEGTLTEPISISGPFVVELTEMRISGCKFFIYASKEREDCNEWGYYIDNDVETYNHRYTPAISVKAMFPALYPKENEDLEILIPATGVTINDALCPTRTIYANRHYTKGKDGFSHNSNELGWCKVFNKGTTKDHVTFAFEADANESDAPREAMFVFTFRGKSITYHLYQPSATWTEVRQGLTIGRLGTICLPHSASQFRGATLWEIAYQTQDEIVLEESQTIIGGQPYIFQATSERLVVQYIDDESAEAGEKNGLYGTLVGVEEEELEGKYLLSNNQFVKCGTGCSLAAYRAYLDIDQVPKTPTPPPSGVRRIAIVHPNKSETAIERIRLEGSPRVKKIMRDGKIYILVEGKEIGYNGIQKEGL